MIKWTKKQLTEIQKICPKADFSTSEKVEIRCGNVTMYTLDESYYLDYYDPTTGAEIENMCSKDFNKILALFSIIRDIDTNN